MIIASEKQIATILNISDRRVRELFKDFKLANNQYPLIKCISEYIQQTRSGDINIVNHKTMAELLGVTEKTVTSLTTKGILIRDVNGKYNLQKNIKNYISAKDEGNKKKAAERKIQEIKLQILENKFHSDEDVRYILTDMLIKFKSKLLATAIEIDNKIDDIKVAERLNFIKNTLIEALEELSEYNPPDNTEEVNV